MKWLCVFLLTACSPVTERDFRADGEAATKALTRELCRIHSTEELQAALPRLRKRYLKMAELALAAHEFRKTHPVEILPPTRASEELFAELARLYELPGGKESLESAQEEAIRRLNSIRAGE